ncbi:hypothetical protein AALC25_11440 [Lachnospiraceae bacterium 29-84]
MGRLVIDGNSVYEIDEECIRQKESQKRLDANGEAEAQGQDRAGYRHVMEHGKMPRRTPYGGR